MKYVIFIRERIHNLLLKSEVWHNATNIVFAVYSKHGEVPLLPGPKLNIYPDTVLELHDIGCVHKVTQIQFY